MKKIVLTLVAVLTMTSAFAADANNSTNEELQAYNMKVNYGKLGDALDLTVDQIDAMKDIHKIFCAEMMNAASADNSEKTDLIYKAVGKGLQVHELHSHRQADGEIQAADEGYASESWFGEVIKRLED